MRRAALIYNPMSGRQISRRRLPVVLETLAAGGYDVEPRPTRAAGDATPLAREAALEGVEVVFAMGGDGTLREAAAGLLEAQGDGADAALGVLPAGTANVLSLALGLPNEARAAARALAGARTRQIDVGWIGGSSTDGSSEGGKPFLMMVSGGLDGAVMARQNPFWKRHLGRIAFAGSSALRWWTYAYPEVEVRCRAVDGEGEDGGLETLRGTLVAVCNIPFYGGAFRMAPDADLLDGKLDLVVFQGRGRLATLAFARDLALGRHLRRADVALRQVREVELTAAPEVLFQVDGDLLAADETATGEQASRERTVWIGLAPRRLRILVPSS